MGAKEHGGWNYELVRADGSVIARGWAGGTKRVAREAALRAAREHA